MQIRVIAVGRVHERYLAEALLDFRARLRPYHRLEQLEVKAGGPSPERATAREGEDILRLLRPHDHVWLLERAGAELSSREFAQRLERLAGEGTSEVTFIIGGAYGTSDALKARANVRWSLSRLTLLHEWARALLYEQLYRAAKIARNEPYHHGD